MAKRVKMKKGSIGKKALAAILAASMVLSSSAFSVLAAEAVSDAEGDGAVTASVEPVEVIDSDAGIAPASLNEENGIMTTALTGTDRILLGFVDPDTGVPCEDCLQNIVYNKKKQEPKVVVVHCTNPNHKNIKACYDANGNKLNATSTCHTLDETKHYYTVEYGNNINAGSGLNCDEEDGTNQGSGSAARAEFAAAGPYVCVNFSNNQISGSGDKNPYAGLGSYFISFKIRPINLDDVQVAITNLQYNHTYTGREVYPGMNSIVLTMEDGEEIRLNEGEDYVARPYGDCEELISASELNKGNTNDPKKDKRVVLMGIASVDVDNDGELETGNYEGTLGDQKYDGNKKNNTYPGYGIGSAEENLYPSEALKLNDNEIRYHINQKSNSDDIKIADDIVISRNVGDSLSVTKDAIIGILNGTLNDKGLAGKGAKVTDSRRAETDPEYFMTCDDGYNKTNADYTVEFLQANGVWGSTPDARTGEHSFRITTTGKKDYKKDSVIYGSYTVTNPSRLQRTVESYCWIDLDGDKREDRNEVAENGTLTIPYDGVDHHPSKWDENTIKIGDSVSALEYGVDYEVTSAKEAWKNAKDSYELTLQGLSGISDETATVKVVITPRNINEIVEDEILDDHDQEFADKGGSAGNNGTEITPATAPKTYNVENQKKANGDPLSGSSKSVVRVLAEQGVHTTSNTYSYSDVVVEITDEGLDTSVGDDGKVTLEEGVDYKVEVKERTDENNKSKKIKYVEIEGINNYTTKLINDDGKEVAAVYKEDVDILKKMPLNSKQITAEVVPSTYEIKQIDQKIKLTTDNIKLTETDAGHDPYTLTKDDFSIIGYEQDGKPIPTNVGIQKPGKAYVVVGPTDGSNYINEVKIPFTVTSAELKSRITIDAIADYALAANAEGLGGEDMAEYLDEKIVVRNIDEPTSTFSTNDYTVTVKDKKTDEVVAYRKYDSGTKKLVWYTDDKMQTLLSDADVIPRGEYTIVVESTDYRYEGTAEVDFNIVGESIATLGLTISYTTGWDYTSKEIKPEVTVTRTSDNSRLVPEKDYTVDYNYNVNAGTGIITLTGVGNYSGTRSANFTIRQASGTVAVEASQKAKLESGVAAGGSDKVDLEVYVNSEKISDEKMTYSLSSNNTNVVSISADGKTMNYVGAGTATITLTPSSTNVSAAAITFDVKVTGEAAEPTIKTPTFTPSNNISKKAKTFTVTTSTIKGASEWEIRYSLNDLTKTTKGSRYVTVKNTSKVKRYVVNCNKSKEKYYIRVRACVNGKWSAWSPQKSIKSR